MRIAKSLFFLSVGYALLAAASGCTRTGAGQFEAAQPTQLALGLAAGDGLEIHASVGGPIHGIGPSMDLHVFVGAEEGVRADLRSEVEGRPQHDVLLWNSEVALLFDRSGGGITDLRGENGGLEAFGGRFAWSQAIWLILGRWNERADETLWRRHGSEWLGDAPGLELSGRARDGGRELSHAELRWTDDVGDEHGLRAEYDSWVRTELGRFPQRLALDGDEIRGKAILHLKYKVLENMELSVFDPYIDP